jgi:hypothetical protein
VGHSGSMQRAKQGGGGGACASWSLAAELDARSSKRRAASRMTRAVASWANRGQRERGVDP